MATMCRCKFVNNGNKFMFDVCIPKNRGHLTLLLLITSKIYCIKLIEHQFFIYCLLYLFCILLKFILPQASY